MLPIVIAICRLLAEGVPSGSFRIGALSAGIRPALAWLQKRLIRDSIVIGLQKVAAEALDILCNSRGVVVTGSHVDATSAAIGEVFQASDPGTNAPTISQTQAMQANLIRL
ncbi:hypothetical protein ACF1BQ_029885 [Bradyrhizobium sp. RDT10]